MTLRCYCCGQALGERFALVGYPNADRVFVMLPEHAKRVDKSASELIVLREESQDD